jgi:hypothetical protein
MDPHDYVCQYDLNTVQMHLNGHHPSAVYRAVCQALTARGLDTVPVFLLAEGRCTTTCYR